MAKEKNPKAFAEADEETSAVIIDDTDDLDTEDTDSVIEIPVEVEEEKARVHHGSIHTAGNGNIKIQTRAEREIVMAERSDEWDADQEDKITLSIFRTALKEGRILEASVAGVETSNTTAYWVLYAGPVTVKIPFNNSFMMIPSELAKPKPSSGIILRQKQMLDRAKGAMIQFVVTALNALPDGSYLARGSRTAALSKIRRSYYGPTANHQLKIGENYMAQVLTNGEHAAYLTFCGIDMKVKKSELSHRYIQAVTSAFHVGMKLPVQILNITDMNGIPSLTVSAKPIEMERFRRNVNRIQAEGSYLGTVTSIRKREDADGSSITISLFLDNVDLPAFAKTTLLNLGNYVKIGDKVSFQALGISKDGYTHGRIVEVIKPRFS